MIGHCGGLRESQTIGDYVLAHAYLRDDHVLDAVLPPDIPTPSIAEVQRALFDTTKTVSGMPGEEAKLRLRTRTVVTTDDRNWELHYSASALRFNLSHAVAVDMERATISAQGYRFRVPYGTLLCVSDKPLHGEIKLPGQANRFYEGAISEHLQIGICAIGLLCEECDRLHSRKLLFDRLKVHQQDPTAPGALLVIGAADGVGSILLQLARALTGRNAPLGTGSRGACGH